MTETNSTGWRPASDMWFSASLEAIALAVTEVPQVGQSMPVAFMRTDAGWRAMAVFSSGNGRNCFLTHDGHWRGHYVPALLRAYPFTLLGERTDKQLKLWPNVTPEPLGDGVEPFLEDGQPTEHIRKTMSFLTLVHADIAKADEAIKLLDNAGVMRPWQPAGSDRCLKLSGNAVYAVGSDRLAALPDTLFLKLREIGALPWIYAHLHSLHFAHLLAQPDDASWSEAIKSFGTNAVSDGRTENASDVLEAIGYDLGDFEL